MLVPFTPFFWGDWWNHIATQCNPCSIALLNPVHFNACPLLCFQSYMFEPHPQKWSGWTLSWLSILSKIASLITCWKPIFQRSIVIPSSTKSQSWGYCSKNPFHPLNYRDYHLYKIPIMGNCSKNPFHPLNPHHVQWFFLSVNYLVKTDHVEHFKGDRLAEDRKNELS